MPAAPRQKSKATKIAWSILGKPDNLTVKRTEKEKRVRQIAIIQQTNFSR